MRVIRAFLGIVVFLIATASGATAHSPAPHALVGADASTFRPLCPPRRPPRVPAPTNTAAQNVLVPAGAHGVLVCRYWGFNAAPHRVWSLATTARVTAQIMRTSLARDYNRLPEPPAGTHTCHVDDSSRIDAYFYYHGAPRVMVRLALGGCQAVTNGAVDRTTGYPPGATLLRRLLVLTHCQHDTTARRAGTYCRP
jgi:hypothetical protein